MVNKVIPLEEVNSFIDDGDTVLVFGLALLSKPMALVRELVRARRKLTVVSPVGDLDADLMAATGVAQRILYGYLSLWYFGLAPNFRRLAESGGIEAEEYIANLLDRRLEAGGQGVPFLPMTVPASDLVTKTPHGRENFEVMRCPWSGQDTVLARALFPDVALVHAHRADPAGNVQYDAPYSHFGDRIYARRTIVSVEEIVSPDQIRRNPAATILPSVNVAAVVEAPFGAHPTACPQYYALDPWHYQEYVETAAGPVGTDAYVQKYVDNAETLGAYLETIGVTRLMTLRRLRMEITEATQAPGAAEFSELLEAGLVGP